MAQRDPVDTVQFLVDQFHANPEAFSTQDIQEIKTAADQVGVEMQIPENFGRMAGSALFNAADSAVFDLLPDEWGPTQLTTADKVAGGLGTAAGFFTMPFALGGRVAGAAARGVGRLATAGGQKAAASGLEKLAMTYGAKVGGIKAGGKAGTAAASALGKGITTAGKGLAGAVRSGAVRTGAAFLSKHPTALKNVVQFGVASGASSAGQALQEGDITPIIERTFGGAVTGGIGAGVSGLSSMIGSISKVANTIGARQAIRMAAAAIYGNMTAPEKSLYPQEYVEEFVKNAIVAYR